MVSEDSILADRIRSQLNVKFIMTSFLCSLTYNICPMIVKSLEGDGAKAYPIKLSYFKLVFFT